MRNSQKSVRSKKEKKRLKRGMKNTTLDRFFLSGRRTISEEGGQSSDTDSKHSTLIYVRRSTGLSGQIDEIKEK